MGVPESSGSQQTSAMKTFFLALAVLAAYADAEPAAEPNAEADADAWYGYYGHGVGYGYRRGYYGGYYGYPYRAYGYYGKRSADAEPEAKPEPAADAYYLGYHGLGYAGYGYGGYRYPVTSTLWGARHAGYYWG